MNRLSTLTLTFLIAYFMQLSAMEIEQHIHSRNTISTQIFPLNDHDSENTPVREALLLEEIARIEQEKMFLRQHHAERVKRTYNSHDRKYAFVSFTAASLVALKSGYDVFRLLQGDTTMWSNQTFLLIDGALFTGLTVSGMFHILRSCIRKPTIA